MVQEIFDSFPKFNRFQILLWKKNKFIMQMRGNIIITNDIHSGNKLNNIAKNRLNDFHYLKWRLQSVNNKRVFLIEDNVRNGFVIAILGRRKKIPLLRIISANGSSSVVKNLIDEALDLRKLGALLCLVTIHNVNLTNFQKIADTSPERVLTLFLKVELIYQKT